MEALPIGSIGAIFAFWMVIVIAFIIFIRRMRIRRANEALQENIVRRTQNASNSIPLTVRQCDPRIIQIYYIGNLESDPNPVLITSGSHSMWNKMLTQLEDHPPSYDEVSSSMSTGNSPRNELVFSSDSLSQIQPEMLNTFPRDNMSSQPSMEACGAVVAVEQRSE